MFILDTDHLGILEAKTEPQHARLRSRMTRHFPNDFYVTIISFHENVMGWNAYLNGSRTTGEVVKAYSMFERILRDFSKAQVLSFSQAAADVVDSFRTMKIRVGTMDLRIAAIGLEKRFTVLSRNLVDFRKVPGLRVEDWTL